MVDPILHESDSRLVDSALAAFENAASEDLEVLRETLSEIGVDSKALLSQAKEQLQKVSGQRKLADAGKRMRMVQELLSSSGSTIRTLLEKIKQSSIGETSFGIAFYRKLEALEDSDLESLQDDEALVEFLIEIDEETEESK